ncbi:MAG: 3-isopropylmalate dehydratase large subunit [Lachnospiraceae bacterium]|nr:3-isopropylmalate dehydratase large subunit [Lachnospiraceae bacterium]
MGKVFRFHTDVDTDQIIASQYLLFPTIDEMKAHAFESLDKEFAFKVQPGDFVVAAENFGCGSSREQAPAVLKALGVKAVVAKSFARIFYRNAINIGLPVIVCKELYDQVADGDDMELSLTEGVVRTKAGEFVCTKLPAYMQGILDQGGLIPSLNGEEKKEEAKVAESTGKKRGMTIAEKIIAAAAGVDEVKPGDIHTVELDRLLSNDGTTHLTIDMYNQKLTNPKIADLDKLVWVVDHNVPCDSPKTAASHKKMRDFAKANGITFYEGKGVCHQIMMENHVRPGELIFGADSHTCAYGALGAFGTGVGCTDYLYAMVTGKSWVLVPETLKFNLVGRLPEGVYARDLILTIIGQIGANGANYKAMEFGGEGLKTLTMSDRIAICNLCVEAGAKTAVMEVDEVAMAYLNERGREPKHTFTSDEDAVYAQEYTIDLATVKPIVAKPHFVDNVVDAKECAGTKIDEAFLGSCNNGRLEDLRVGAELLKGRKVHPLVRFLVVPASQEVYQKALAEGLIDIFMEAGAIVMNANCSVCWGSCQGVIGENEVLISTGTRNFKGRAGHRDSFVYLASAATVTASAIKGEIATADML